MAQFTCVVNGVQYLALPQEGCAGQGHSLCGDLGACGPENTPIVWVKRTPETEIAHVTYLLEQP
jgi:hypothetical protein